ncbi:hypothetical protein NG99_12760 [Erwinia typographi]|uniref:Uncharacterized protein n=1 Tax=Erwinia typographi TaxID=371042 RepID=A0A0A4A4J6_9GAMM|nr:hypothetical protein NG99_12760 [Erwinia typographi]
MLIVAPDIRAVNKPEPAAVRNIRNLRQAHSGVPSPQMHTGIMLWKQNLDFKTDPFQQQRIPG